MPGPVATQVSLDLTTIAEALEMARGARRAGVDWLEAGTPLILGEGLHAVKALRKEFPGVPIVADLKTMDGAGLEAEMMLGAGATHVVVMSRAHWASVKEMVKVAHRMGGEVMADVQQRGLEIAYVDLRPERQAAVMVKESKVQGQGARAKGHR